MKKRLLAVFMALCLIVGLLPVSVLAVETENITMTVGDTRTIDCDKWAGLDPIGVDEYWKNSDYRFVQITNYNYLGGKVTFKAISPGTTTITLYKDKGKTQVGKVWKVKVEEDHRKGVYEILGDKRDSFTFSADSSNIEVAYSYVVDEENNACSDLISMERGEIIRLPGLASDYPIAFYVRASKGYVPAGSTFECAGSQGQYLQIGTVPGLPMSQQAEEQNYTKEFSFSDRKSGYPDREFKITAVPVKVSVNYVTGTTETVEDTNVYAHENVKEIDDHIITVSSQEPTRSGYVFMGWEISTDGVELSANETYQGGETITLDNVTWISADKENATITFTAQWEKDENDDSVPDIYQATVTYQVENGTWDDVTRTDKTEVVTLLDAEGNWDELGEGKLEKVPSVGECPDDGYEAGSWSPVINDNTVVQKDTTFIYSFVQKQTYNLTYNANGGTFGESEEYEVTGIFATDEYTLGKEAGYQNPTHDDDNNTAVAFAGWSTTRNKTIYNKNATNVPTLVTEINFPAQAAPQQGTSVYAVWGYDKNGNGVADAYEITITPAKIIVYMGGDGYEGAVTNRQGGTAGEGTKNGFPEPGFTIELPASISTQDFDVTKLVLTYTGDPDDPNAAENQNYQWKFEPYDGKTGHNTVYRIIPAESTKGRPIRMQFTNPTTGETFLSDTFEAGRNLNQTLTMKVYGEGIDENKVLFLYDGKPYDIAVKTGELIVRGTTGDPKYDNVNESKVEAGKPGAIADEGTKYYINGDANVEVSNPDGVALLFDDVIDDLTNNENRHQQLENRAEEYFEDKNISATSGNVFDYEFKYLDLVDTNNGNAWVQADKNVTISWPLPEGTTKDTEFKLLHFKGLHREQAANEVADSIAKSYVETVTIVAVTDTHVVFKAGENGFSPFALVWETKAPTYTITASAGNGGSISPTSATVSHGGSQTFSIVPNSGYHIYDVTVDGVSQGNIGSYTFTNVTSNRSIHATFAKDDSGTIDPTPSEYTLRYETNGGKKIDSETYKKAWTKDYDELPVPVRAGYVFEGWYRNSTLTMPVTGDVYVNSGVVTLFAKWSEDDGLTPDDTGVSRWLNTEDHFAYLQGMPNNSFGPGQNITRAEVAQMFYNLLLNKNVPTTVSFTDVPADAWYADAVNALASMGILNGVGDGKFEPTRNITRAEFTAIAMRFADLDTDSFNPFSDINANDWFYEEVVGAVQYGWIKGFTDGTFHPYLSITRAEVTVITNRMLGRSADQAYVDKHSDELRQFSDVGTDNWAYYDIAEATNNHDYAKSGSGERWSDLW